MTVPTISPLPEAPSTTDSANFDSEADAFVAALQAMRTQQNAQATYIDALLAGAANVGNATSLQGYTWDQRLLTKNLLINGDGVINQRAPASVADDVYDFDRWYALTQTGAVAPSAVGGVADGTPYMMRLTQSQASAQRMGRAQIIEGVNCKFLRGQPVVLSVKAKISASQPIRYAILAWTGTEDAVTSDVVNDWTSATYTAGNFFLASNLSIVAIGAQTPAAGTLTTLNAITGTVPSNANNLIVVAWTEGTAAQNVTLDLSAKLEWGSVPTNFFDRRTVGEEDAMCRRYCRRFVSIATDHRFGLMGQAISSTGAVIEIPLNPPMRAAPSVTVEDSAGSYQVMNSGGSTVGLTALAMSTSHASNVELSATVSTGLTAGNATQLMGGGVNIGRLTLSAEL